MFRAKLFNVRLTKQICDHLFPKTNVDIIQKTACQSIYFRNFSSNLKEHEQSLTLNIENPQSNIKTNSEREFLVKLKNDPDTFGTQRDRGEVFDGGDEAEEKFLTEKPHPSQKLRTKQYADKIKSLIQQRRIKEAIDVLEVRMLKDDRVKPEAYIYNLILGALGRVGYTKKAFMLYNDMKKRGLNVMGGTYTALFNACANSPWPTTDGLARAKKLYDIMIEKGHKPNDTTYNAMIKAFGRGGDISMAFQIADEMMSKKIRVKSETINFLLQACITNTEAGFRHALLVWRKMMDKKIKPDIHTYNLLLRSVRDCSLGDIEVTRDVINKILPGGSAPQLINPDKLLNTNNKFEKPNRISEMNSEDTSQELQQVSYNNDLVTINSTDCRPNLLARIPHLGNIISLSQITKPEERLLLVGGCKGFLENMEEHECKPDIKTFTQLLDCIPGTDAAEKELLSVMKNFKIKPDVDFCNMLIKKKSMRSDYKGAKEILELLHQEGYRPDLITYGVLSMGCKTKGECDELLLEMDQKKYNVNCEILGTMLRQASCHHNFEYVLHVMELCLLKNVRPNKKFMETLENFKKWGRKTSNDKKFNEKEEKMYRKFKNRYKTWKEQVHIDETEDAHPWQQYRQKNEANSKYKVKDTTRFKPRHASLFKIKTSPKYKQAGKNKLI